jgi:hypothetical protein
VTLTAGPSFAQNPLPPSASEQWVDQSNRSIMSQGQQLGQQRQSQVESNQLREDQLAVCQPVVPVVAAIARMEAETISSSACSAA